MITTCKPARQDFWLPATRSPRQAHSAYHLQRNRWVDVHFKRIPDGTLFAGDGGDSEMVARAPDGNGSICPARARAGRGRHQTADSDKLIDAGFFKAERLVDMRKHDYRWNPRDIPPDMKWVVFRSQYCWVRCTCSRFRNRKALNEH